MKKSSLWRGRAMAAVLTIGAVGAVAQEPEGPTPVKPPTPRKSDDPPFIWNLFAVIVIAGAIFGANMIPSKRGHQD